MELKRSAPDWSNRNNWVKDTKGLKKLKFLKRVNNLESEGKTLKKRNIREKTKRLVQIIRIKFLKNKSNTKDGEISGKIKRAPKKMNERTELTLNPRRIVNKEKIKE